MKIREVIPKIIRNSRGEETIEVVTKTKAGSFAASAPAGKSVGKYETPTFIPSIKPAIKNLKAVIDKITRVELDGFYDLVEIEKIVPKEKFGANTCVALEFSLLKALAAEQGVSVWQLINPKAKVFPFPVGNCIGGGKHTPGKIKPEFQEFEMIAKSKTFIDRVFLLRRIHDLCGKRLGFHGSKGPLNNENAWSANITNKKVLEVMEETREEVVNELGVDVIIGLDVAANSFFSKGKYNYPSLKKVMTKKQHMDYVLELVEEHEIGYLEDPFEENDFEGFRDIKEEIRKINECLIVGDDLTVSQLPRLKQAVKKKAISALIVKPNQNGSLLEIKEVMDYAKSKAIKTIVSHRSGETEDYVLADIAFGMQSDYIKTGVLGPGREIKLNRLIEIEKGLKL